MRSLSLSLALVVASAAVLSGCASTPGAYEGCAPTYTSSGASDGVHVDGAIGGPVDTEFQSPFASDGTSVTFVERAGAPVTAGDAVIYTYTMYSARTGVELVSSFANGSGNPGSLTTVGNGSVLSDAMLCATEGSRLIATAPLSAVLPGAQAEPSLGILTTEDTIVVVVDVIETFPGQAQGWPMPAVDGMPAIAIAPDGTPGITLPSGGAPDDLTVATTIRGDGAVVEEGQTVLVQYTGVVWESGAIFDSSWETGTPTMFALDEGVIDGFRLGIVGQTVGSQVVVSIPEEYGYNDPATRPASIPEGAHLVFVIDILGVYEGA